MDSRLFPSRFLGLAEGDAHVIRNAGGSARDALRSLVISQRQLETREVAIVKHTECGMLMFTNADLYEQVRQQLGVDAGDIDFLPFASLEEAVRDDIRFLASSPLIAKDTVARGFIYDVRTGHMSEVEQRR
jgi:carbonic anhydrase